MLCAFEKIQTYLFDFPVLVLLFSGKITLAIPLAHETFHRMRVEVLYRQLQCFDRTQAVDIAKENHKSEGLNFHAGVLALASK